MKHHFYLSLKKEPDTNTSNSVVLNTSSNVILALYYVKIQDNLNVNSLHDISGLHYFTLVTKTEEE